MDSISDKYRKYLISIIVHNNSYYTLYGSDIQEDYTDKILVNQKGLILLFSDQKTLKNYLLENFQNLFDKDNVREWAGCLNDEEVAYSTYNIDISKSDLSKIKYDKTLQEEVLNLIILLNDYASQLKIGEILSLLDDDAINEFKDYYYDSYIWDRKPDTLLSFDEKAMYLKTVQIISCFKGVLAYPASPSQLQSGLHS